MFDQLKCIITEEHGDVVLGDHDQGPGVESEARAQEGGSAPSVCQPVVVWLPDLQGSVDKHQGVQARVTHLVTVTINTSLVFSSSHTTTIKQVLFLDWQFLRFLLNFPRQRFVVLFLLNLWTSILSFLKLL